MVNEVMHLRFYGLTDRGKQRENNEDYIYVSNVIDDLKLFIVADGMGGANAGEVASKDALESVEGYIKSEFPKIQHEKENIEELIRKSIVRANKYVFEKSKTMPEYKGMGTTIVVVLIYKGKVYIGHVGDSRVYRFRKHVIRQLTKDHSYVQELVKEGTITREEAKNHPQKNILLKVIGCEKNVDPDVISKGFIKDDIILICTDGLTNMLDEKDIYETIMKHKTYLKDACKALIDNANLLGGYDNISVVLISND